MPTWGPKESLDPLGHGPHGPDPGPGPGRGCRVPGPQLPPGPGPGSGPWGPCVLALGPCPKGSKDSLGPHVGMYFHKKVWKSYQMYKSRVLLCEAPKLIIGFLTQTL